ncbi:MAG TPA: hypothetical protein ENL18_02855 [Thermoplasmatales archaeon]|nr:hypothetical protein [Thermoplasmatales archaeon]
MKKLAVIAMVLLLLVCSFQSGHASAAGDTSRWEVKWHKNYKTVNNTTFGVFIGSEYWNETSFYHNWGGHRVYEKYTDNIGFEATTQIYSGGGKYELRLYDVDDYAWVTLDGKEVLRVEKKGDEPGNGSVNLEISKGQHMLKVNWEEECCKASIGFAAPDELFNKDNVNNTQNKNTPGFETAATAGTIVIATIFLSLRRQHKNKK